MSRILSLLILLAAGPAVAGAQELPRPRPSQHGTVSQEVVLTTITVGYDRPVARGMELYGGIVDWDVVATPRPKSRAPAPGLAAFPQARSWSGSGRDVIAASTNPAMVRPASDRRACLTLGILSDQARST